MKFILPGLMMLIAATSFAQSTKWIISAQNKNITVSGEDDNEDKLFLLKPVNTNAATDYLTVKIVDNQIRKTWSRSFYIYDEKKQVTAELKFMDTDEYCIKIKDVLSKLQKGKVYNLYSIVNPHDQTKAYMVKIPPVLLCKIKIDDN